MIANQNRSLIETAGYSLSDVAINLVFQILVIFLLKFAAEFVGMSIAVYAAFAYLALLIFSRWSISPYFNKNRPSDAHHERRVSLKSKPLRVITLVTLLIYISLGIRCAALSFYFYDYASQQVLTTFILVSALAQLAGVVLYLYFQKKGYGDMTMFALCLILIALFTMLFYIPQPNDIELMFMLCILTSLIYGATVPMLWDIVSSVADDIEFSTKLRTISFSFSATVFALKAGLAIGIAITGLTLIVSGYVSETNTLQSWSVIQGIRWASSILPALFIVAAIAILFSHSLNEKDNWAV